MIRRSPDEHSLKAVLHGKNGFVTATKLGTTNNFFVAATKNFGAASKRFVDRTKQFVVVTKYMFVIRILTNDFVGITKPFIPCTERCLSENRDTRVSLKEYKILVL